MKHLVLILALLVPGPAAYAAPWFLIPSETSIEVDVRYQNRSTLTVGFPQFAGAIDFDEKRPQGTRATIQVSSQTIRTGLSILNPIIKSSDYLDARNHPNITFQLDRLQQTSKSTADIFGRITFLGVTRPIAFKANVFRYEPVGEVPGGFEAGFDLSGEFDRREFGNTTGLPDVAAVLPVRIRLLMSNIPPN